MLLMPDVPGFGYMAVAVALALAIALQTDWALVPAPLLEAPEVGW